MQLCLACFSSSEPFWRLSRNISNMLLSRCDKYNCWFVRTLEAS
jgi:hypothetical protein